MANYNIVVDTSNFKPLTYNDIMAPYNDYAKDYDANQERIDKINESMSDLKYAVQNSPEAKRIYDEYNERLQPAIASFANGMTARNATELGALRNLYFQNIRGLEKLHELLKKENDARREERSKDDSIVYEKPILTLDDFMGGKTPTAGISADKLQNRIAVQAQLIGQALKENDSFKNVMRNQYWQINQHTGAKMSDIVNAMMSSDAYNQLDESARQNLQALRDLYVNARKSVNLDKEDIYDNNGRAALESAIRGGMFAGLDNPKSQYQGDQSYVDPARSAQIAIAQGEYNMKKKDHDFEETIRDLTYEKKNGKYTGNYRNDTYLGIIAERSAKSTGTTGVTKTKSDLTKAYNSATKVTTTDTAGKAYTDNGKDEAGKLSDEKTREALEKQGYHRDTSGLWTATVNGTKVYIVGVKVDKTSKAIKAIDTMNKEELDTYADDMGLSPSEIISNKFGTSQTPTAVKKETVKEESDLTRVKNNNSAYNG